MKKLTIFVAILLLFLITVPAFAWVGVHGAVYDAYGDPWKYGFSIYLSGTVAGVPNQPLNGSGTAVPAGEHTFSVPYVTPPDENTAVSLRIAFNEGDGGKPPSQLFANLFVHNNLTRGYYLMDDINTNTGPTVINLQSARVAPNTMPGFSGVVLLTLLLVTFTKIRQHNKQTGRKQLTPL